MERGDRQLLCLGIGLHDAKIGDHPRRPGARRAGAQARVAALAVAERGDERQILDERALAHRHGDEDLAAMDGDLRRAAAARQPDLRLVVGADNRRVEIGEAVDLRAAEKTDGDAAALQPIAEHLRHADGAKRRVAQLAVADRQRQRLRLGADRAALVDQRDARRVRQAREIAGGGRRANADEADVGRRQRARRGDGHHFGRRCDEVSHAATSSGSRRACWAKTSGPASRTFVFIQSRNVARSRAIASQAM